MGRDISLLGGRTRSSKGSRPCSMLCTIVFVLLSNTQVTLAEGNVDEVQNNHQIEKKSEDLLPYPRMGRSTDTVQELLLTIREQEPQGGVSKSRQQSQEQKLPLIKHQDKNNDVESHEPRVLASEYMVPYLRPGRSGSLKDDSDESDEDVSDEDDDDDDGEGDTMIPYPRFGRSAQENGDDNMIPTIRFGRSDKLLPYLRFGRSDKLLPYLRFGRSSDTESDEQPQTLTPYPRFGKRENEILIPYPRFGRRSSGDDILLPYPRIGRSGLLGNPFLNYTPEGLAFLTSFPWFSPVGYVLDSSKELGNPTLRFIKRATEKNTLIPSLRPGKRSDFLVPQSRLGKKNEGETILPYPRIVKSEGHMTPYLRFGKRDVNDLILPYPRTGRSEGHMTPYLRFGKRDVNDLILPYPRPGRSEGHMTPYLRFGKRDVNDLILPYPRPGRSEGHMTPYLRFGKRDVNDLILPYPRPGRSQQPFSSQKNQDYIQLLKALSEESESIIPYPRMGKKSSSGETEDDQLTLMLPQSRFGRSTDKLTPKGKPESMKPITTSQSIGKEDNNKAKAIAVRETLLPHLRLGRSKRSPDNKSRRKRSTANNNIVPYPRLGRNSDNLKVLVGKERSHPKVSEDNGHYGSGNKNYMLPYMRPGRSALFSPSRRSDGENLMVIPYLRMGRSN